MREDSRTKTIRSLEAAAAARKAKKALLPGPSPSGRGEEELAAEIREAFPRSLLLDDLGKRVLAASARWTEVYHTRVAEFSPSGKYVHLNGGATEMDCVGWIATDQVTVLEVLPERDANRARDVVRELLLSADCKWIEHGEGHDWKQAVEDAQNFLASQV